MDTTRVNFGKLSLAAALALSLGLTSLTANATCTDTVKAHTTSHGRVMQLGTIHVSATDVEGGKKHPARGRTAYLGRITVTRADSDQAHYAAREAARTGALYLGTIEVTADDSLDARYAARLAAAPGTAYLGSIRVTRANSNASLLASAETGSRHLSRFTVLRIIGALAFGRAGG